LKRDIRRSSIHSSKLNKGPLLTRGAGLFCASNVRAVGSVNSRVDAQVLAAAREFRFHPATLDQQPVPVDLHLSSCCTT
jgi:hypothetical protein